MLFCCIWFGFSLPVCASDLGVGPADCWHCVASVDGGLCVAWRLPVVTVIIIISFLNSRFYKALHSGRDMRGHDKMTKISLFFHLN